MSARRIQLTAPPVERTLGEKVLRLSDRLRAAFTAAARTQGLTFAEGRALRHLSCREGEPRLTDLLECTPARVTRILNKLEQRGYVTRTASTTDRRAKVTTVTPRGQATVDLLLHELFERSPLMTALTEPQRETFEALVDLMAST